MKNFYAEVKERAKGKANKKKNKAKSEKSDFVDEIEDGPGVVNVNGINVRRGPMLMPTWVQNNARYHINLKDGDSYHVTREGVPKIHYSFRGTGTDIVSDRPSMVERGRPIKKDHETDQNVNTKRTFADLPQDVQDFIRNNWNQILG